MMTEKKDDVVADVVDKLTLAENWRSENDLENKWDKWKDYYEGTSEETEAREAKGRSHLLPHWPSTLVDHLLARYCLIIFGKKPYYVIQPLNEKAIESAKVAHKLVAYQIQRPYSFYQIIKYIQTALTYGFSTLKTAWDFALNDVELSAVNIKDFYFSPAAKQLNRLPWAIHKIWALKSELIAQNKAFKAQTKENLYQNLDKLIPYTNRAEDTNKWTAKEKENLVCLYEYWDERKKVVVANKEILILHTDNPTMEKDEDGTLIKPGIIPFINCSEIPKLDSILGKGEPESIEEDIRELATLKNQRMDNVNLALRPPWLRNMAYKILNSKDLANIRPGIQLLLEGLPYGVDMRSALQQIEIRDVTAGSYNEASILERGIEERSGLYGAVRGAPTTKRQTATEHMGLQTEGSTMIRFKIMMAIKTAFSLLPMHIITWDKKYMQEKLIVGVMGAIEGVKDFKEGVTKIGPRDIEGDFEFLEKVSASDIEANKDIKIAHLLQALQIIIQAQGAGVSIDIDMTELFKAILEALDIPELNVLLNKNKEGKGDLKALIEALVKQGVIPPPGGNGGERASQPATRPVTGLPATSTGATPTGLGQMLAATMGKVRGGM